MLEPTNYETDYRIIHVFSGFKTASQIKAWYVHCSIKNLNRVRLFFVYLMH